MSIQDPNSISVAEANLRVSEDSKGGNRLRQLVRRHWVFMVLLTLGVAVRSAFMWAYRPGFWFPDTEAYTSLARGGFLYSINVFRPAGYSWWLAVVDQFGGVRLTVLLQHSVGVLLAIAVYSLLVRRPGSSPLIACAGVLAALFAPSVIASEHSLLSEALFLPVAVLGLVVVVSRSEREWLSPAIGGLLLSASALFRSVGIGLIILGALYLIVNLRWQALAIFTAVAAAVLAPYVLTYHALYGDYAMTGYEGGFLYSRIAPIADCAALPAGTPDDILCDRARAVGQRPDGTFYLWSPDSPAASIPFEEHNERLGRFARTVITSQKGAYLGLVGADLLTYFDLGSRGEDPSIACSLLPADTAPPDNYCAARVSVKNLDLTSITPDVSPTMVSFAIHYGHLLAWPRWLLVPLLVAPFALLIPRPDRRRRLGGPFLAACGLALLVAPALTSVFDYRYELVTLVLLPIAAAIAVGDFRAAPTKVVPDDSSSDPDESPPQPSGDDVPTTPAQEVVARTGEATSPPDHPGSVHLTDSRVSIRSVSRGALAKVVW